MNKTIVALILIIFIVLGAWMFFTNNNIASKLNLLVVSDNNFHNLNLANKN